MSNVPQFPEIRTLFYLVTLRTGPKTVPHACSRSSSPPSTAFSPHTDLQSLSACPSSPLTKSSIHSRQPEPVHTCRNSHKLSTPHGQSPPQRPLITKRIAIPTAALLLILTSPVARCTAHLAPAFGRRRTLLAQHGHQPTQRWPWTPPPNHPARLGDTLLRGTTYSSPENAAHSDDHGADYKGYDEGEWIYVEPYEVDDSEVMGPFDLTLHGYPPEVAAMLELQQGDEHGARWEEPPVSPHRMHDILQRRGGGEPPADDQKAVRATGENVSGSGTSFRDTDLAQLSRRGSTPRNLLHEGKHSPKGMPKCPRCAIYQKTMKYVRGHCKRGKVLHVCERRLNWDDDLDDDDDGDGVDDHDTEQDEDDAQGPALSQAMRKKGFMFVINVEEPHSAH